MRITETCPCGAKVVIEDRWASCAERAAESWRSQHRYTMSKTEQAEAQEGAESRQRMIEAVDASTKRHMQSVKDGARLDAVSANAREALERVEVLERKRS
jgi:hypothetical protein